VFYSGDAKGEHRWRTPSEVVERIKREISVERLAEARAISWGAAARK
jgi:hypothetical protein